MECFFPGLASLFYIIWMLCKNLVVLKRSYTSISVDFVQCVFIGRQHAHVRSEFLHQDIHHFLCGGSACHADTFGHHIGSVLEVEPHHSVELARL